MHHTSGLEIETITLEHTKKKPIPINGLPSGCQKISQQLTRSASRFCFNRFEVGGEIVTQSLFDQADWHP